MRHAEPAGLSWRRVLLTGTVALLPACQNLRAIEEGKTRIDAVRHDISAARADADATRQQLAPLVEEDGAWLARRSIPVEETDVVPARFYQPASFHAGRSLPLSLILEKIAAKQGIAIHVGGDTLAPRPARSPAGPDRHAAGPARSEDGRGGTAEALVQLNYTGTLRGLLDALANRSGTFWTYRDGSVVFARYKTRTFQIASMPGTSVFTSSVGSQAKMAGESGGGRSAGGADTMQMDFGGTSLVGMGTNLNFWDEANATIQSMLSPAGQAMASAATNSVTVTDTADVIDRVRRFVDRENAVLGRQVSLQVKVFSVKLNHRSQSGIDWNLAFQAGGVNAAAGLGGLGQLVDPAPGASIQQMLGPWKNSRFLVAALQKQGEVTTVVDTSIVTLNNQPAPLAVTNNLTYLSKVSMSQSADRNGGERLYSAEPANLTTGFIMNLMPTLLDNRSVMLQIQLNLSSLISKNPAKVGRDGDGGTITTPETSAIQTLQRASLKSGETLLLTGFRRDDNNNQRKGLFSLFTGDADINRGQEEFVILITPQLIEGV